MFHATTIVSVRRGEHVVIAGDGQVTMGESVVVKQTARKVRRLHDGKVLCGFAGSTADAMTLFELLESKLKQNSHGSLVRAAVEVAKEWRTDRMLRRLEAMLIAADRTSTLLISGTGDVLEPEEGVVAIGSGGNYALAAARALLRCTDMSARAVAEESMRVASSLCVYTNEHLTIEELGADHGG